MTNGGTGVMITGGMGYRGCGPHGQWGTWAMAYRGMGYRDMGHTRSALIRNIQWLHVTCTLWPPPWTLPPAVTSWGGLSNVSKDVKLSKRCQIVKHLDCGGGLHKKINWHNEVYRHWHQFCCHIWWSLKTLKMFIESIFVQFWWPLYVMSKLTSIYVNLMSIVFFCEPPP